MRRVAGVLLMVAAGMAQAADREVGAPMTPVVALRCPAGATQVGGPRTPLEATLCAKVVNGERTFHGPYQLQWPNGQRRAEGQYLDGFRSGRWTFWDERGVKTTEIDFVRGDYHGRLVEFHPNGQVRLQERWQQGQREGVAQRYSPQGQLVSEVTYRGNHAVATR